MGYQQVWGTDSYGGYLAFDKLSKKIRHVAQPMMVFRQFARVEPGLGKNRGDTLYFDRVSDLDTPGAALTETDVIPESRVSITRGNLVMTEYGRAVPFTGKLEALAEFSPDSVIQVALKNDQAKVLDSACGAQFQTAQVTYTPTGTIGSPGGTFSASGVGTAATRDVMVYDIKMIRDYMVKTMRVPKYDGKDFICIASTDFLRGIKDDNYFIEAKHYGDPQSLFNSEVGRLEGIRFIEETNVLDNTIGTTSYGGEAVIFGEDPVVEGVAIPEEIRVKIPEDYGRIKGVAWYYLGGYQAVWSDIDPAVAGQCRIVHITST